MLDRFLPSNPRLRALAVAVASVAGVLVVTQLVLPGPEGEAGRGTPAAILFQGLVLGLVYSLFAVSVVLVYRTLRIINFALGPLGGVGATLAFQCIAFTQVPFPVALLLGLLVSAALGLLVGLFMLRFFNASRLFLTVVTIVGSSVFGGMIFFVYRLPFFPRPNELTTAEVERANDADLLFPFRGFEFEVGSFPLKFGFSDLLAVELCVLALLALGLFLRYTRSGVALRAMAENPERASLLGIGVGGLSVVVWVIAGVLDGLGVFASRAATVGTGIGFLALMVPFAAAVLARFRSIPVAIGAAIALTVLRSAWNYSLPDDTGLFFVVLFVVTGLAFLLQRRQMGRSELGAEVSWSATDEPRPIPKELSAITGLRLARWGLIGVGVLAVVLYPFIASTSRTQLAGTIAVGAIAVLSLVVLTGWAGQVSLAQWSLVAIGSVVSGALTAEVGLSFWLAVPLTTALSGAVAVVVGLPALRIRGLFLLVTTFAFAAGLQAVLFDERYFGWLLVEAVERPTLFFLDFEEERSMYFLCVLALVGSIVVVTNLRRSRVGRLLIAVRENEANVQAFGVSALRLKLLAFAIAGSLAGFAGAIYAHHQRGISEEAFAAERNVEVFLQAVLGGVSSPGGALLGAAYFEIVREIQNTQEVLATFLSSGGPLLIVFLAPGGFISLVNAGRDSVLRIVAQRRRIVVPSLFADYDPEVLERRLIPLAEPDSGSGLAALPIDDRFVLDSELYQGEGERARERVGAVAESADTAALNAAARSAADIDELTAGERQ